VLINPREPVVVVPARLAAALRVRVRGTDPLATRILDEIHEAALAWRGSATEPRSRHLRHQPHPRRG
jgi:hypothetical protein